MIEKPNIGDIVYNCYQYPDRPDSWIFGEVVNFYDVAEFMSDIDDPQGGPWGAQVKILNPESKYVKTVYYLDTLASLHSRWIEYVPIQLKIWQI